MGIGAANVAVVEVVYAEGSDQQLITLKFRDGETAAELVQRSGIANQFPALREHSLKIGVFGKQISAQALVHAGDRVEIYRPLLADPKEARRRRARKNQLGAR